MSKAFTKEPDANADESDDLVDAAVDDSRGAVPPGSKNYMTPAGAERLRNELKRLLHVERPEVVKTVSWAASNGDRSENGDYIYGKRRLREIDRRIRFLTKRLDAAEVIDPASQVSRNVLFGATVTVEDEDGAKRRYVIVGIDESQPSKGWVSWISPVARALLGAKCGDVVTLHTPKGDEELEVKLVEYRALE